MEFAMFPDSFSDKQKEDAHAILLKNGFFVNFGSYDAFSIARDSLNTALNKCISDEFLPNENFGTESTIVQNSHFQMYWTMDGDHDLFRLFNPIVNRFLVDAFNVIGDKQGSIMAAESLADDIVKVLDCVCLTKSNHKVTDLFVEVINYYFDRHFTGSIFHQFGLFFGVPDN
eukprot:3692465-Rhodomonas_salina.1